MRSWASERRRKARQRYDRIAAVTFTLAALVLFGRLQGWW